jgi:hypothetical protein
MGFFKWRTLMQIVMTEHWLDVDECAAAATSIIHKYKPDRMKITLLSRDWVIQTTGLPIAHIMGASREVPFVNARYLWGNAMWAAGYSYPQISRAMYRKDHSTAYHIIHTKKCPPEMAAYRRVAIKLGRTLSEARLAWLDNGEVDLFDPLTIKNRHSGTQDAERRRTIMRGLEQHMDFGVETPRVINKHPAAIVLRNDPSKEVMDDLARCFKREMGI